MNACDVIGYTYNADYHCTACAIAQFGEHPRSPIAHPWCADGIDADGNAPTPIFGDSEWWDPRSELQVQVLRCCDCHEVIDHTGEWSPNFQPLRLYLERNPGKEALPWEYMGTNENGTSCYREREHGNRIKLTPTGRLACVHVVADRSRVSVNESDTLTHL
jgi:hypothetical protein